MMRHLLPHAIAFYEDGLGQSDTTAMAKGLAGRLLAEGHTEITLSWLGKNGSHGWRHHASDQKRREVLIRLVEWGWLVPVGVLDMLTKKPSRYLVNPAVHTLFAEHRAGQVAKMDSGREIAMRIMAGAEGA